MDLRTVEPSYNWASCHWVCATGFCVCGICTTEPAPSIIAGNQSSLLYAFFKQSKTFFMKSKTNMHQSHTIVSNNDPK